MKKRFTLTEVLVVVFLIGLLTAIGFGMYGYAMNSAREKATRSLFARLEAALESCNTKFGYFPTSSTVNEFNTISVTIDGSSSEITALNFGGRSFSSSATSQAEKDYLREFLRVIDAETLKKSVKSGVIEDSWGGRIYYAYPGQFNKTSFDLYSAGPDGRIGTSTDTPDSSSPTGKNISVFKDTSDNSMKCDDIVNF